MATGEDYAIVVGTPPPTPPTAVDVFELYEVFGTDSGGQQEDFGDDWDDQLFLLGGRAGPLTPEGLALYAYIGFVVGGGILLNLVLIKGILQAKYSGEWGAWVKVRFNN